MKGKSASPKRTEPERTWRRLGRQARHRIQRIMREKLLRGAGEMFATVFRESPQAMLVTRRGDGLILDANAAFERLSGHAWQKTLGRTTPELGIWESEQARESLLEALEPPANLKTFEGVFRTRSGEERLWRVFIAPCDLDGDPCLLTAIEDFTERRRIQEHLQMDEERFRTLVENVHEVIYLHDRSDVFTYLSPQTHGILGYRPEDLTGKTWTSICLDSPVNRRAAELTVRALETGQPAPPHPVEAVTKDGRNVLLEIRERPYRDAYGNVVGLVGSARDVTEVRAAEEALRESESRLRELFHHMSSGVAIYEPRNDGRDFVFKDLNRAGERITGVSCEAAVGKSVEEVFPGVHDLGLFDVMRRVWRTGEPQDHPTSQYQDQRLTFWTENRVYKLPSGDVVAVFDDRTEHKQAEQALQESEARYRSLLEYAGLGIGYFDENGRVLLFNRVAAEHMGGAPEDFIGKSLEDLFGADDAGRYLDRIQTAAQAAGSQEYEDRIPLPTGAKWFSSVYTRIPGASGELLGIQVISADITERKRAEEALRQSEQRFRVLFEEAPDAYYFTDLQGTLIEVNRAAEALVGRRKEELVGHNVRAMGLLSDASLSSVAARLDQSAQGIPTGPDEIEVRRGDGSLVQVEIQAAPVRMGDELRVLGIGRDITHRKLAEAALRESEERFRFLFENAPDAYYMSDLGGIFLAGNSAAEKLIGYRREALIGQSFLSLNLLDPADLPRAAGLLARNTRGEATGPDEFALRRKDGSEVLTEIRTVPVQLGGQTCVLGIARDISERRRAEQALRESEARLRAVVGASPDITLVLDEDGRYVEILTSAPGLLYAPAGELQGRLQREVLPPEVAEAIERAIRRVLETGGVQVVEYQLDVAEGRRWFEARLAPLTLTAGDKRAVVSVVRDVTSQKSLGVALEERASQLALVNETAQGLVGTLDLEGVLEHAARIIHGSFDYHQVCIFLREGGHMVLRANAGRFAAEMPAGHRLALGQGMVGWVGQTGDSLLANDVSKEPRFYNPLSHDRLRAAITLPIRWGGKVIGALDVESEELDAFDVNDEQVLDTLADQLAVAIRNARLYEELEAHSESLEHVVAQRTEELRRSRDRISAIVDNSPDAVVFLGPNGAIERGNRAFENLFGYAAEMVVGQLPTMLLRPKDVPLLVEAIDRTVAENSPVRFEAVAEREDGREFDVDVALGPIPSDGTVAGIVCSLRDISALKEVERMKDAFVSNVSHELRTPITSLRLNAGLLRMNPDRQSTYIDRLQREVDRLSTLIEDLLRLSRLDQGQVKLDMRAVDLNLLVAQYAWDRAPLAESRGLRLDFEAHPGLPPVTGDPGMLGQVLSILLTNAVNYTPGGGTISIRTADRQAEGKAWSGFSVSDTGPGIDPEEQVRVFDRFFRGKTGRESGMPGTGLGLAIADEIVRKHQGRIGIQSPGTPGEGTTFTVWLPAVPGAETFEGPSPI